MAAVHPRPAPARPGPRARDVARLGLACAVVATVVVLGAAPAWARPSRGAQDPGVTTTVGLETSTSVVPVSTTVAPDAVDAPATTVVEAPATGAGSRRVADENRKIWGVVAGLVAVAIALSLLTIRYWRKTRPVAPEVQPMLPTDAALAVALTSTPADGPGSTEPVPAVDEAVAEEPVPAVDETAVEAPVAEEPVVPSAWAPAAAAAADLDRLEDTGDETAPVPVVDVPPAEPATGRRAVAGADHAAADEAWEPRGTGEHERVVVASTARATRLTPEQRAALFAGRPPRDS